MLGYSVFALNTLTENNIISSSPLSISVANCIIDSSSDELTWERKRVKMLRLSDKT